MITRKDYLDGKATFEAYYTDIIRGAGLDKRNPFPEKFIEICRKEYEGGNVHLNFSDAVTAEGKEALTLEAWEMYGRILVSASSVRQVMEERGDYLTIAGLVCLAKLRMEQILKED